jgi:hypothetical protein
MSDPFRVSRMRRTRRVGASPAARSVRPGEGLALYPRGAKVLDTTPDTVLYWMTKVSRERAMRAYRLKKKGIVGSLPELLTYDWLESRNHIFDFQSSIMGGRLILGGAVADFIIEDLIPGGLVIWRVQGDYWHTQPKRMQSDFIQRERLLTESYMGVPVEQVVDLWESAIYWAAPLVFEMAEGGVGIGRRAPR